MYSRKVRKAKFMKIVDTQVKFKYSDDGCISEMKSRLTLEDAKGKKHMMYHRWIFYKSPAPWYNFLYKINEQFDCGASSEKVLEFLGSGACVGKALRVAKVSYYGMNGKDSRNSWLQVV